MSQEKKTELIPYRVELICDCGGQMLPTGVILLSDPPQYPHRCNKCGKEETCWDSKYPYIEYKEKPDSWKEFGS